MAWGYINFVAVVRILSNFIQIVSQFLQEEVKGIANYLMLRLLKAMVGTENL